MASPAAILQVFVNANTKVASAQLAAFEKQLQGVGKTSAATGAGMGKFTKGAAAAGAGIAALSVAVGVAGKQLYDLGKQFDDAYDSIRVGTGATGKELERLKGSFRNVARTVPNDFKDVGNAVADLNTRLGLTGKPLEKMSQSLLNLSNITETDLRANIKSVARAFVDWEIAVPQQVRALDGLFRLSQKSGASVDQLASSVQQFGSPLRQLGFSFGEASSAFALFERAGVNTQTMVPGLKLAISNLTRPTDALAAQMKSLGIAAGQPDVALRQIFDLLGKNSNLSKIEKTGLAMDVFGKRAGADMAEAIKQGRFELDAYLKVFRDNKGDTIAKAASEAYDFSENIKILGNNFKVLLEPAANAVFVAMDKVARSLSEAFQEAENAEDVMRIFVEQAMKGLGKLVEKSAELAPKVASAFVQGFYEANVWGKLAVGAIVLKMFGGRAAIAKIGTLIGVQTGTSMAAGIAAGMSGGAAAGVAGAAAGGGLAGRIGGVLKNIKWARVGMIGVGLVAADMFMQAMAKRVQAKSADLTEAMRAIIEPGPDLLGINLNPIVDGITESGGGREVAKWIEQSAQALREGSAVMSQAREAEIRSGLELLDLTSQQEVALEQMFDVYRGGRAVAQSLGMSIESIRVSEDMSPEALNRMAGGFEYLKNSVGSSMSDINKVTSRNAEAIRQNFGEKTKQGRKMLALNMSLSAAAIGEAMNRGEISTEKGTKRIRQLLRNARLVDPTRNQARQIGNAWAQGFTRMGKITNRGVGRVIAEAKKMPGPMRRIAVQTMLEQLNAARKSGDISAKEYRKGRSKILREFTGLRLGAANKMKEVETAVANPSKKAGEELGLLAGAASRSSRRIKNAVKGVPGAARGAFTRLAGYANNAAAAFDSTERVSLNFRKGGVAKFSGPGLVPAMVSPGELISYKGREVYVPGRPEPRDSVMMQLPPGAKVFTFDGQARLAMGASQNEALRKQAPHFARGGIVGDAPRPRLVGGARVPTATGQAAIDRAREQAIEWVKRLKPTLDMITRIARGFGLNVTSGLRVGDDGYHGVDRARDYSNSSGPTPEMFKFGTYVADNYQKHLLELIYSPLGFGIKNGARTAPYAVADHYDHVHVAMRNGGVVPRFRRGGWVKTGYTVFDDAGGGYLGSLQKGNGYAELGTAYPYPPYAATGKGLIARALGMSGELPHKYPLDVKINGKIKQMYKRDRGWGQGDTYHSIDIYKDSWPFFGISGSSKGNAWIRPSDGKVGKSKAQIEKAKKEKARRKKVIEKIGATGFKYKDRDRLARNAKQINTLQERIEVAEALAGADFGPGGSDETDKEIAEQKKLYKELFELQKKRARLIIGAIREIQRRIQAYRQRLSRIRGVNDGGAFPSGRGPKADKKWKEEGFEKGIGNAQKTVRQLQGSLRGLVGITGVRNAMSGKFSDIFSGDLGSTNLTLKNLGVKTSDATADSELASLLREQLTVSQRNLAIAQAQAPVFQQFMPKFHQGGIVQGPRGAERPIMAQAGEGIFTRDQMRAMGSQNITVVIEDGAIDSNRIRVEVDGVLQDKISTVRRSTPNRRYATR